MTISGFHGTSAPAAERILAGEGFRPSRNEYDWLGDGVYFFQDAPERAREWARERFGSRAAVLGAEVDLTDCIDLLDIRWQKVLEQAHAGYVELCRRTGVQLPRQTSGAHRLDRHVINYLVGKLDAEGITVRSVRAAFPEGEPIFPGSALLSRAHVQVVVRDPGVISQVWREF